MDNKYKNLKNMKDRDLHDIREGIEYIFTVLVVIAFLLILLVLFSVPQCAAAQGAIWTPPPPSDMEGRMACWKDPNCLQQWTAYILSHYRPADQPDEPEPIAEPNRPPLTFWEMVQLKQVENFCGSLDFDGCYIAIERIYKDPNWLYPLNNGRFIFDSEFLHWVAIVDFRPCYCDWNHDGRIDLLDWEIFTRSWHKGWLYRQKVKGEK